MYLARSDGQLVYAADTTLLAAPVNVNDLWNLPLTDRLVRAAGGLKYTVLEPSGMFGRILWTSFSEGWNTYLVLEKTGESVADRVQTTMRSSLFAGGLLAVTLYGISLSIILAARKKIGEQTRRRTGEESCLLLLDIDNFKRVNDSYGHPAGDVVLSTIAGVIVSHLRNTDHVARFGGEEFAILLPGTSPDGAHSVADKIRGAIESCCFDDAAEDLCVTVSIGIAPIRVDRAIALDLAYQEADRALYRAKDHGRDRIELAVRGLRRDRAVFPGCTAASFLPAGGRSSFPSEAADCLHGERDRARVRAIRQHGAGRSLVVPTVTV